MGCKWKRLEVVQETLGGKSESVNYLLFPVRLRRASHQSAGSWRGTHQYVERGEDGARRSPDLCSSRRKLPEQKRKEKHIGDQEEDVPEANPVTRRGGREEEFN